MKNNRFVSKIIMRTRVGSHLYGLNDENSDEDWLSIFIPQKRYILGLEKVEIVDKSIRAEQHSDGVDEQLFSLEKYIKLLLKSVPNSIEILFAGKENIDIISPEFEFLRENCDKILSKKIVASFGGYALAQIRLLFTKRDRFISLKKAFAYLESYKSEVLSEEGAQKLNSLIKYYKGPKGNTNNFHKGMETSLVKSRIEMEINKYGKRVLSLDFSQPLEKVYDTKFAYHSVRMLLEAKQLLKQGRLVFPFTREDKEILLAIKNRKFTIDEISSMHEEMYSEILELEKRSSLRSKPHFDFLNNYLMDIYEKAIFES